ncbi:MAG TPA: RhuM family protein, partial [bacterium]|nr:RhuM family protein [bacterium]
MVEYLSVDGITRLDVLVENESVWLNQLQIAELFGVKQPAISKHIKNIYDSSELDEKSTYSILEYMGNDGKQLYKSRYYNLDMIISIGYRVNSVKATRFRVWATKILKSYLLKGYVIDQRFEMIEKQVQDNAVKILKHEKQIEKLVRQAIPPKQGVLFEGQVFDAHKFVSDVVRSAEKSIILIDNYVDDTVLTLFSKRKQGVVLKILTKNLSKQIILDIQKFNEQFPPAEIKEFNHSHDRFMIIDEKDLYHFGASLKDLGKKWFGFSKMDVEVTKMLARI